MLQELKSEQIAKWLPLITEYGVKVIGALVLFVAAAYFASYLKEIAVKGMEKGRIEPTLAKFGGNLIKWTVLAIAIVSILGMFGVQTASFAAVIAAMGLAIGLAFQGTLSNFAAGVMLLLFRPFKVGHMVRTGGEMGFVHEINIFTTSIDTPDKRRIILPNSAVFNGTIENMSYHQVRRCDIAIGTAYEADLEQTKQVLHAVAEQNALVLKDPAPAVVLTELGSTSINWAIRAYCRLDDYWTLREQLLWESKYALDRAGISIPFPQLDVHIKKDS